MHRVFQLALIIGIYDLIELLFELLFVRMIKCHHSKIRS